MKILSSTFLIIFFVQKFLLCQGFNDMPIYFEDSLGNKDTIEVGYGLTASDGIDEEYGEVDILGETRSDLDIRFFSYENISSEDLIFDCGHDPFNLSYFYEDIALHEAKKGITESGCAIVGRSETFSVLTIPADAAYPITMRWSIDSLGSSDCAFSESFFTERSKTEILSNNWCRDELLYDSISLNVLDSFVLDAPGFKTIPMRDSTLLSVFYIFITDFGVKPVGVKNLFSSNLKISPNPVQDKLYLETTDQNWNYQILNLQGQLIGSGAYRNHIDVEQLPSGIYFLQLEKDGELYQAIKFVKE